MTSNQQKSEYQAYKNNIQQSKGLDSREEIRQRSLKNELHKSKSNEILGHLVEAAKAGRIYMEKNGNAQYFTLENIFNEATNLEPNTLDQYGRLALIEAIIAKQNEAANFLLDKNANPNKGDLYRKSNPIQAAIKYNLEFLDNLMNYKANINSLVIGNSPLHIATEENINAVEKVLSYSPNINAKNSNGDTALIIAAARGKNVIVEKLISQTNIDKIAKNNNHFTAIDVAAINNHADTVNLLLTNGFDPNKINNEGQTTLHLAAKFSAIDALKILITANAKINVKDIHGYTPIDYAEKNKRNDIVAILVETQKEQETLQLNEENKNSTFTDDLTASSIEINFLTKILTNNKALDQINENGTTALHIACAFGYKTTIKSLLTNQNDKINLNIVDRDGNSLLHAAITAKPYLLYYKAATEYELENYDVKITFGLIEFLINNNINLRIINNDDLAAIHVASNIGHYQAIKTIYNKDPTIIELGNANQLKPIHFAAIGSRLDIVKILAEQMHVNIYALDNNNMSAIDYANEKLTSSKNLTDNHIASLKNMIKYFIDHNLYFSHRKYYSLSYSPTEKAILANDNLSIEQFKKYDLNPFKAAEMCDIATIINFIKYGFNPSSKNNLNHTIIDYFNDNNEFKNQLLILYEESKELL